LPHVNVLSKCDLLPSKKALKRFLDPDMDTLMEQLAGEADAVRHSAAGAASAAASSSNSAAAAAAASGEALRGKNLALSRAMASLVTQYSMVNFFPLDLTDDESLSLCLQHVDRATAYGEDLEPKEPHDAAGGNPSTQLDSVPE
jgi:hypothetical protein